MSQEYSIRIKIDANLRARLECCFGTINHRPMTTALHLQLVNVVDQVSAQIKTYLARHEDPTIESEGVKYEHTLVNYMDDIDLLVRLSYTKDAMRSAVDNVYDHINQILQRPLRVMTPLPSTLEEKEPTIDEAIKELEEFNDYLNRSGDLMDKAMGHALGRNNFDDAVEEYAAYIDKHPWMAKRSDLDLLFTWLYDFDQASDAVVFATEEIRNFFKDFDYFDLKTFPNQNPFHVVTDLVAYNSWNKKIIQLQQNLVYPLIKKFMPSHPEMTMRTNALCDEYTKAWVNR